MYKSHSNHQPHTPAAASSHARLPTPSWPPLVAAPDADGPLTLLPPPPLLLLLAPGGGVAVASRDADPDDAPPYGGSGGGADGSGSELLVVGGGMADVAAQALTAHVGSTRRLRDAA